MSSHLPADGQFLLATKRASRRGPLLPLPLRLDFTSLTFHSHGPRIQRGTEPAMTTKAKERLNAIPRSA